MSKSVKEKQDERNEIKKRLEDKCGKKKKIEEKERLMYEKS